MAEQQGQSPHRFHVIASTADGHVFELDIRAMTAAEAVQYVASQIDPTSEITNLHVRRAE